MTNLIKLRKVCTSGHVMHLTINERTVTKKDLNLYNHGTPTLHVSHDQIAQKQSRLPGVGNQFIIWRKPVLTHASIVCKGSEFGEY